MSIQALSWALKQQVNKSSEKFVLVCLCNYADENGYCFPSIARLELDTCQDRKTIIGAIKSLINAGFLTDTGKRRGRTKSIIVYQVLKLFTSDAENGTTQKQAVPKTDLSSTENGRKQYRFSAEAVPKTVHRTIMDPSGNPLGNLRAQKALEAKDRIRKLAASLKLQ